MNRPLIPLLTSLLALAFSASVVLADDAFIVEETFETTSAPDSSQTPGGYESKDLGVTATRAFKEGVGVNGSRAMVLTATLNSGAPASLAAIGYQNGDIVGNDSTNCSDYYVEFDAKGSKPGKEFQVIIQGVRGKYFQGESTGGLLTTLTLPDKEDTFKTYHVALDDSSFQGTFDPSGKTWQIFFQIFSSNWGGGEGNTLVIDNIKIGRKSGK